MVPITVREGDQGFRAHPVTNGGSPKGRKADKSKRRAVKQAWKVNRRK